MEKDHYTDEEIKQILTLKKVGVVGISRHSAKAAHFVPKYLSEQGYDICLLYTSPSPRDRG